MLGRLEFEFILISMTIWGIWKPRSKNSINNQDVALNETREAEVFTPPFRSSEEKLDRGAFHGRRRRLFRPRELRILWAEKLLAWFGPNQVQLPTLLVR